MFLNLILRRLSHECGSIPFVLIFILIIAPGCKKKPIPVPGPASVSRFDSLPTSYSVTPMVSEISGIADSKVNPGFIWGEQDSNNSPVLFLINHHGKVKKKVYIKGVANRDWEDMTLSGDQIYLADIGDNYLNHKSYAFYHFKEPSAMADTVYNIQTIRFKYPDGSHNAEAVLIDAATKNIFIITKNDDPSRIYQLSPPYKDNGIQTATQAGTLNYTRVVSACQSPDGKEIIIKTYLGLLYYKRGQNQTIVSALSGQYIKLPYTIEPQGEAVCFANDNSGFYTLSEKGIANFVKLYFYGKE